MHIQLAQIQSLVGDIRGNKNKIIAALEQGKRQKVALLVFPEMFLTGYPVEDLLFQADFAEQIADALNEIKLHTQGICVVIGTPLPEDNHQKQAEDSSQKTWYNSAVVVADGQVIFTYHKTVLPNSEVFDDKRYFKAGENTSHHFDWCGTRYGLAICEDIWSSEVAAKAQKEEVEILLVLNASPYHFGKIQQRHDIVRKRIAETSIAICYCNAVGGQDELVFDGNSFAYLADGKLLASAAHCQSQMLDLVFEPQTAQAPAMLSTLAEEEEIYQVLVTGLADYFRANKAKSAILGLSGGIDSALCALLVCDALGKDMLRTFMLPYRFTSQESLRDARDLADQLGVEHQVLPIEGPVAEFYTMLQGKFPEQGWQITSENIQSRCRGLLLMAIANNTGGMVVVTGNKSELAVGYATLYGDMAGGFAPLMDVNKTTVYKLANWLHRSRGLIPKNIIDRPPSAELAPNQLDSDSLPDYDTLDKIITFYVEQNFSVADTIQQGFEKNMVIDVLRRIDRNEYKRRQAAIGTRITQRAFGKDRRMPVSSNWVHRAP